ncbi:MAG: Fic family protein [Planctomycetota bacterium]
MRVPEKPPPFDQLLVELFSPSRDAARAFDRLLAIREPAPGGRYVHWDKLRHLAPPEGFSRREWWAGIKLARSTLLREIPLRDQEGRPFKYGMADPVLEAVHLVEREVSGQAGVPPAIESPETRDRYLVSSLTEEAITSSMLEGAATTREIAKEMIRSGRPPRDRGERMVLNNYRAMEDLRGLREGPLTPERVLDLQRRMTEGILDEGSGSGRFRRGDEEVVVADEEGTVLHRPPDAGELPDRVRRLCDFANGLPESRFVHPVVRAILLHFWLAFEHPFVDGNGRTARALFYWSMLRSGYRLCEFVSISSVVRRAPSRYARSFLYAETDDNDVTYFLLEQLRVIRMAFRQLNEYLERKATELRSLERLLRRSDRFNHRQLALLSHALRYPEREFTFRSHRASHNVTYQTARTDLLDLAKVGLLLRGKVGKRFVFRAPPNLDRRLRTAQ